MPDIKRLPPLQSLIFFEAAARHLNFTLAAQELGMSQPAVSQRIQQLEQELGVALFARRHRGVALTVEGESLFQIVCNRLADISEIIEKIKQKQQRETLRIATDMGFASYWLLPRLASLQRLLPDVDVQITTSPNEFSLSDSNAHLAIAFGNGHWPGCYSEKLFPSWWCRCAARLFCANTARLIRRRHCCECPCSICRKPSRAVG